MSEEKPKYLEEALEMIGIDLSKPKQIIQEVSGFTPLFDAVVQQYKDETRAAVHGAMWRFCQMEDGVCKASLSTIADMLGISPATVMRHAEALCEDGYFTDLTPDLKNRPHVYADTGKVVMKSKLNAGISQRNVGISQRNVGISESQLSKVFNKDSKKDGTYVPNGIENKIFADLPIEETDLQSSSFDLQKAIDVSNLIGTGQSGADGLALAFQKSRKINLPMDEKKIKAQRKAAREMLEMHVKPQHVQEAVKQLLEKNMTVIDLYSVSKTAISLANPANTQPAPEVTYDQDGAPESW